MSANPVPTNLHKCQRCGKEFKKAFWFTLPGTPPWVGDICGSCRMRHTRGENHSRVKYTEKDIRTLRALSKQGMSRRAIAAKMGMKEGTVGDILRGRTWSHLED